MTVLLIMLVVMPWSIWRQMQVHEITRAGLLKPPLIFAAVGVLGFGIGPVPNTRAALGYVAVSAAVSIGLGLWRGALLQMWTDAAGRIVAQGNRTTLVLWGLLLGTSEIFLAIGVSFAAQNLVVADRIARPRVAVAA